MDRLRINRLAHSMTDLAARAEAFSGNCFRCVKPKYSSSLDAFSGEGSRKASGRFHVRGKFVVVYTSVNLRTAEWEYFNTARSMGIDSAFLLPFTAIGANAQLAKVLNLNNPDVLRAMEVTLDEICGLKWDGSSEETLTQLIGRLAYEAGFEAILAPSAGGGQNLIIFCHNLLAGSRIEIINEDDLPHS